MLGPVLAWVSAILGIFIGFNFILPSSAPVQHNIGCYLTPINYTSTLKARLTLARELASPLLYQHKTIVPQGSSFDKHLMTVATSFEKYVQRLGDQQRVRAKDHQILSAIHDAEESFTQCRQSIRGVVDSVGCNNTWNKYMNCFAKIEEVRSKIEGLLKREKEIQNQIKLEMEQPKEDSSQKPEFLAQLAYNDSIKDNEAALADLQRRLSEAQIKLSKTLDHRSITEDHLSFSTLSYNECSKNRQIYKHCQQISQRVKGISSNIIDQLRQQIRAKERLMNEMMNMMLRLGRGNRKVPEHWTKTYSMHKDELIRMYQDLIYNTNKENKACGCKQQEEKRLLEEVTTQEQTLNEYKKQIDALSQIIETVKGEIKKNQKEREKIIQDYQKALKDFTTIKPQVKETSLIRLKKALESNRNSILEMEDHYNQIDGTCKIIKMELAGTIKDLDKVEDCLDKKEYLKKLRAETAKYLQPDRSLAKLNTFRKELAQVVQGLALNQ